MRRQYRLQWWGTGHSQASVSTRQLFTQDWPHLSYYPPIFLLVPSKPPWSLPFPVLGYSPKHTIRRLPQSQNAFSITHPIICTVPLDLSGGAQSLSVDCWGLVSFWLVALRVPWDSPLRGQAETLFLWPGYWDSPACPCTPMLLWAWGHRSLMGW